MLLKEVLKLLSNLIKKNNLPDFKYCIVNIKLQYRGSCITLYYKASLSYCPFVLEYNTNGQINERIVVYALRHCLVIMMLYQKC